MIQAAVNPATYPGLHLLYLGTEECEPGKSWGPGVKDHYKIHYIQSGNGYFNTKGQSYNLGSNKAFLIEPGQVVQYEADTNDPWTYSWIIFDGDQAAASLARAGLDASHPIINDTSQRELGKLIRSLVDPDYLGKSTDIRQQSIFLAFMAALVDLSFHEGQSMEQIRGQSKRESKQELYVRSALLYLEVHYSGPVSIETLARHVGIDRKYLSALFKQHVHESPQDYLSRFRMEKAQVLLRRPELRVADVARSVGYQDPLVFSKAFRTSVGISPRDFRKDVIKL